MRFFIKTIKHSIIGGDIVAHDNNYIMSDLYPNVVNDLIESYTLEKTMYDIFIFCDKRNVIRRINRKKINPVPINSNFIKTMNLKTIQYKIEARKSKLDKIC